MVEKVLLYRSSILLLLAMALIPVTAPAFAAGDAVTLIVGGEKVFLHTAPRLLDGTAYVPLAVLNTVGAKGKTDGEKRDGQKVEITAADGRKLSCPARLVDGELMLPIRDIAPELGAVAAWDDARRMLSLRANIRSIDFDGSQLRVDTSYPVKFDVSWWKAESKLILDVHGVSMPLKPNAISIDNATSVPIRLGVREDGETGRIVLDMPGAVGYKVTSPSKTSRIVVSVSGLKPGQSAPSTPPDTRPSEPGPNAGPPTTQPSTVKPQPPKPPPPPVKISGVDYRKLNSRRAEVYILAGGPVKYDTFLLRGPDKFVVKIPNAVLEKELDEVSAEHDLLLGISAKQLPTNTVTVTMDLARIAAPSVSQDKSTNRIVVSLEYPKHAGGKLAEKVVVLDPGHGGKYAGTPGIIGVPEKHFTLQIARRVRNLLMNAGVAVFMTRDGDTQVHQVYETDLWERTRFANRHSADLFVSIHCNSCTIPNSVSGTETYYRSGDGSGRALAECLQQEIVKVSGLQDRKAKGDPGKGFVVLRGASGYGIPAALIEVGFLNNIRDASKIRDPEFQQRVAEAIVKGLKSYIEDNPEPIKRTVDPDEQLSEEASQPAAVDEPGAEPAAETDTPPVLETPTVPLPRPAPSTGPHRPGE